MAKVKYVKVVRSVETKCIISSTDLPVCNKRLIEYTAKVNRTTEGQVSDILTFIGKYTHGVIARGVMETVMLPYFGKFKPKVKELQARALMLQGLQSGKHAILKEIRKQQIIADETARGRRKS